MNKSIGLDTAVLKKDFILELKLRIYQVLYQIGQHLMDYKEVFKYLGCTYPSRVSLKAYVYLRNATKKDCGSRNLYISIQLHKTINNKRKVIKMQNSA